MRARLLHKREALHITAKNWKEIAARRLRLSSIVLTYSRQRLSPLIAIGEGGWWLFDGANSPAWSLRCANWATQIPTIMRD